MEGAGRVKMEDGKRGKAGRGKEKKKEPQITRIFAEKIFERKEAKGRG
jgi:hypothetical protein